MMTKKDTELARLKNEIETLNIQLNEYREKIRIQELALEEFRKKSEPHIKSVTDSETAGTSEQLGGTTSGVSTKPVRLV